MLSYWFKMGTKVIQVYETSIESSVKGYLVSSVENTSIV